MIEPRDPDRGAAESRPLEPSSAAGPLGEGGEKAAGEHEVASSLSPPADATPSGEEAMLASTVTDGPTDDVTRVLPPPTVTMGEGAIENASSSMLLGVESDPLLETIPDEVYDPLIDRPAMVAGYEILGVLGRGTMGVVYKARQRGLDRVVALKMIRAAEHSGPADLVRFRAEAVALARLHHPNIVQIYEVSEDRGHPFFSLEYVDGGSLARKIGGVPQPPGEAAPLVRLLADAMESAHHRGIVHRDLKPANVLLTAAEIGRAHV